MCEQGYHSANECANSCTVSEIKRAKLYPKPAKILTTKIGGASSEFISYYANINLHLCNTRLIIEGRSKKLQMSKIPLEVLLFSSNSLSNSEDELYKYEASYRTHIYLNEDNRNDLQKKMLKIATTSVSRSCKKIVILIRVYLKESSKQWVTLQRISGYGTVCRLKEIYFHDLAATTSADQCYGIHVLIAKEKKSSSRIFHKIRNGDYELQLKQIANGFSGSDCGDVLIQFSLDWVKQESSKQVKQSVDSCMKTCEKSEKLNIKLPLIFRYHYSCGSHFYSKDQVLHSYRCPLCDMYTSNVAGMMMHLNCSHSRLYFTCDNEDTNIVINVTTYDAMPNSDLDLSPFYFVRRCGGILQKYVDRKLKTISTQLQQRRQNLHRVYYHSRTAQPYEEGAPLNDSDYEEDETWINERNNQLLDEFADVSFEEKLFMKYWNEFSKMWNVYAFKYVPEANLRFAQRYRRKIVKHGLRQNFNMHLVNLFDFGLLNSQDILECLDVIDNGDKSQ